MLKNVLRKNGRQRIMRTRDIMKFVEKAHKKHNEFMGVCDVIVTEAKKHILYTDEISCDFYPGDGICLCVDGMDSMPYVVPATTFFKYAKSKEGAPLHDDEIRLMSI